MKYERFSDEAIGIVNELHHERLEEYEYNPLIDALNRLAEFEDKIENGTLVELPCKVGDKAYAVWPYDGEIEEWIVKRIEINNNFYIYKLSHDGTDDYMAFTSKEVGEYIFFNKEQAEAKSKEFRGK